MFLKGSENRRIESLLDAHRGGVEGGGGEGLPAQAAGNAFSPQSRSIVLLGNLLPQASIDTGDHKWEKSIEDKDLGSVLFPPNTPFPKS